MAKIQKITPFMWFDDCAEEAIDFYVSIFDDSRVLRVSRLPLVTSHADGIVIVSFELEGMAFTAIAGGPVFQFSPAISFVVGCETQEEIDRFSLALASGGGRHDLAGWIEDRFGVSWQVVPAELQALMEANPEKVMEALLDMTKIDLARLRAAASSDQ